MHLCCAQRFVFAKINTHTHTNTNTHTFKKNTHTHTHRNKSTTCAPMTAARRSTLQATMARSSGPRCCFGFVVFVVFVVLGHIFSSSAFVLCFFLPFFLSFFLSSFLSFFLPSFHSFLLLSSFHTIPFSCTHIHQYSAAVDATDMEGYTPLSFALNRHAAVAELLISAGASEKKARQAPASPSFDSVMK